MEVKQSDFCEIVALASQYIQADEGNAERLKQFLSSGDRLWDTADLVAFTGWGRQYISKLCSEGRLPFIPGRPNKFIQQSVKAALVKMQVGAGYGRRKSKLKPKTHKEK